MMSKREKDKAHKTWEAVSGEEWHLLCLQHICSEIHIIVSSAKKPTQGAVVVLWIRLMKRQKNKHNSLGTNCMRK